MNLFTVALCFIVVIIYKILSNAFYFYRTVNLFNDYQKFLKKESDTVTSKKQEIKKLFSRANIENSYLPVTQPAGYGYFHSANFPIIDNMFVNDSRVISAIIGMFEESIGLYKSRIFEAINPLYWIESIIYLPRTVISYLGLSTNAIAAKILQVIWWVVAPLAIIYRNNLISIFQNLIN